MKTSHRQAAARTARRALVDTMAELSDEEFERGATLCAGWPPRDVLGHLLGTAEIGPYVRAPWRMHRINARAVQASRARSREELIAAGRVWAELPTRIDRLLGPVLIGDVAMHHQDVLRGLGRTRQIPPAEEAAIYYEGVALTAQKFQPVLLRYRVEPVNGIGRPLGRGVRVRGTAEALGMWLGGRKVTDARIGD